MSDDLDEILDSIFHGCAWAAYIEEMIAEQAWPPDSEATRQRAFRYYEDELARKNRAKAQRQPERHTASSPLDRVTAA